MGLDKAYKEIFASNNLHENLSKINGEYKDNELVSSNKIHRKRQKTTYLFASKKKL